jgi:transposase
MSSMVKAADSKYQVTANMVSKALKLKCSDRVVLDALHERGVEFHPMREKPVRTEDDEKARRKFAKDYKAKPATYWEKSVDAYIDNKYFPLYLTGTARAYAAKRTARGSFRKTGEGLAKGHVKPRKNLKQNFGKGVLLAVAISGKKVLMCHEVKGRWNAAAACSMYQKELQPSLKAASPSKRSFRVLEDNDPTGYKSRAAIDAKADLNLKVLEIPKRSPDLNPLDYAFWALVGRRLREQEAKFATDKKETRREFVARLRRTVLRVPAKVLGPMVKSMKRRCVALQAAKGADFEE